MSHLVILIIISDMLGNELHALEGILNLGAEALTDCVRKGESVVR